MPSMDPSEAQSAIKENDMGVDGSIQSPVRTTPHLKVIGPNEVKRIKNLVVVQKSEDWSIDLNDAEIVDAETYLKDSRFYNSNKYRVFNLCNSYDYCSKGYYVSLLAEARGHRPLPAVATLVDMKSRSIVKVLSEDVQDQIQKILKPIRSKSFVLSVYFGRNLSKKYEGLARVLFNQFRNPLLRARFEKKNGEWTLKSIRSITMKEIPSNHTEFFKDSMLQFFKKKTTFTKRKTYKYEIAILVNPKEELPPSDAKALDKFMKAGENMRLFVDTIEPKDLSKITTFDGLFIRETTDVANHTFEFARRAEAEGLVVIDDPGSILHCCNKVYLHELLHSNNVPVPRTTIISKSSLNGLPPHLKFPLVLKKPDSAFSTGVKKVKDELEFQKVASQYFEHTELLLIQDYIPTDFDWRVGLLDGEALFVCRYFMAKNHWQIINHKNDKQRDEGRVETIPLDQAPPRLLEVATRAGKLIGNSLYGVDIKQRGDEFYVIEVNDNPNIDCGYEDKVLKDELYDRVMQSFLRRLEKR